MSSTNQIPPDDGNDPHRKLATVKLSAHIILKDESAPNVLVPVVEALVVTIAGGLYKKVYSAFPINEDLVKTDWDQNWKTFTKWDQTNVVTKN